MNIPLVGDVQLLHPTVLWGIAVAAVILFFLLTRQFVRLPLLPEERRRARKMRVWLFVSRLLVIALVLLALAHPYVAKATETSGNPRVTLLVDSSASMQDLDTSFADGLAQTLQSRVTTTVRTICTNSTSDVGSAILRNLDPGGNVLLVSDGNVNSGAQLGDVAFYATTINATVSAINLSAAKEDAAIVVTGPSKVVADSDSSYAIVVTSTEPGATVHVQVDVDGVRALDKDVLPGTYPFTERFAQGGHRIDARITTPDAVPANDEFYKEVTVLPKPKILLLTQKSDPLELLLRQLYDVDKRSAMPTDLSPYYAIVADDVPVETFGNAQALNDYLIDADGGYYGNGLVLFGGLDSFNYGGYAGSPLEPFLPVRVGQGQRNKGAANLVFVIDISGSSAGGTKYQVVNGQQIAYNDTQPTLDVIKAQVVNAIQQLKIDNRVGIVVFGAQPRAGLDSAEATIEDSVKIVEPLDFLYNNRKDILDKVPRLTGGGPSAADVALQAAIKMLQNAPGDKNIVFMTDGRFCAGIGAECAPSKQLLALAANAHKLYGINFMTVGIGTTDDALFPKKVDETFLKSFAAAGDGTYDRATKLNTLLIKWGDPQAKQFGQEFTLVPLSLTHFITQGIEPTAVLNGYNQVVPKDTADLLIAADSGDPALTVWQYGNGRVATWTVFAGDSLGQLLNDQNSLLISRTINWAIGDPQRKEPYYVDIPDTRTDQPGTITVQSKTPVSGEGLSFSKDGDTYTATFQPAAPGFATILGQEYAVNRPSELDTVGMNPLLDSAVEATGGKIFKPSDSDAIVEFIKQASRKVTVERKDVSAYFLVAAMLLLLIEIAVRRITERRRR